MVGTVLYPRFAARRLTEALDDSPVILIHGPRQCGKTALAQLVCAPGSITPNGSRMHPTDRRSDRAEAGSPDYHYLTFDDEVMRGGAEADPAGFVADLPAQVILEEVQRVPSLFAALKMEVDRRRRPGRFVLTGSSNVLLVPRLSDSLAGRIAMVRLHPLAQCELSGPLSRTGIAPPVSGQPGFLGTLFDGRFRTRRIERLGVELAERIVAGGYPAALARPAGRRRAAWYRDYIETQVQRDVRDLSRIRGLDTIPRLLTAAAGQTARLINISDLAGHFQLSRPTIDDYVTLLERVFLLERLPPWHSNQLRRLVKTPKLHLCDTGVACSLLGVDAAALRANRPMLGQLLETFVFQELSRQASWDESSLAFYHYRDKDKLEVDIVIERGALQIAGVEVKAGATVNSSDFRGLRRLMAAAGNRFSSGVVLYDGEACTSFGDGLFAVPIRLLWETPTRSN